ncbi:tripartite tricarboxylate transporter TctB family protein [Falsiroseomonas oryziterrae]|uniref:tripartite tricarboxylate transporter TctB family protein n=1 Tax=Falsiroseomonas oryziterrae TaxID=2911368 RepID=UPI001F42A525|nr:tripartite tricarboxylate transporter TctB family protein [Roseomonas sp. NPKOSM-4]
MLRIGGRDYRVQWGHVAFLGFIALAIGWYLLDARSVSTSPQNLMFIQPVALFGLGLVLFILPQCLRPARHPAQVPVEADPADEEDEPGGRVRVIAVTAALGVYAVAIPWLGFDIATWLFILATMAICGERRPLHLLAYPAITAFLLVWGFTLIVPFPMPNTLL